MGRPLGRLALWVRVFLGPYTFFNHRDRRSLQHLVSLFSSLFFFFMIVFGVVLGSRARAAWF